MGAPVWQTRPWYMETSAVLPEGRRRFLSTRSQREADVTFESLYDQKRIIMTPWDEGSGPGSQGRFHLDVIQPSHECQDRGHHNDGPDQGEPDCDHRHDAEIADDIEA